MRKETRFEEIKNYKLKLKANSTELISLQNCVLKSLF